MDWLRRCVIWCGAAIAASQAAAQAPTVHLRSKEVYIPFRSQADERLGPVQPLLFVSVDQGRSWRMVSTAPPERGMFGLRLENAGEYWFSIKSLDGGGQLNPPGEHVPSTKVVLDFSSPGIVWDVWLQEPNELTAQFEITDQAVDAASLTLECLAPDEKVDRWKKIALDPRGIAGDERRVRGKVATPIPRTPGRWTVRISVRDRAGNQVESVRDFQVAAPAAPGPIGPLGVAGATAPWVQDLYAPPPAAPAITPGGRVSAQSQARAQGSPERIYAPSTYAKYGQTGPLSQPTPAPASAVPLMSAIPTPRTPLAGDAPPSPQARPEARFDLAVAGVLRTGAAAPAVSPPVPPPASTRSPTPHMPWPIAAAGGEQANADALGVAAGPWSWTFPTAPQPLRPPTAPPDVTPLDVPPTAPSNHDSPPRGGLGSLLEEPPGTGIRTAGAEVDGRSTGGVDFRSRPADSFAKERDVRPAVRPASSWLQQTQRRNATAKPTSTAMLAPSGAGSAGMAPGAMNPGAFKSEATKPEAANPEAARPAAPWIPLPPADAPRLPPAPTAPPAQAAPTAPPAQASPPQQFAPAAPLAGGAESPPPTGPMLFPADQPAPDPSPRATFPAVSVEAPGADRQRFPPMGSPPSPPAAAEGNGGAWDGNAPTEIGGAPFVAAPQIGPPPVAGGLFAGAPHPGRGFPVADLGRGVGGGRLENESPLPEPNRLSIAFQPPQEGVKGQPVELLPPLQQQNIEYDIMLRAARNAVATKDWPEAVRRFDALLERFPDDVKSRGELAGVLIQADQVERAIREYRKLVESSPEEVAYMASLIDALISQKKFDDAIGFLEGEERAGRMSVPAAAKFAVVLGYAEQRERAIQIYDKYLSKANLSDPTLQELLAPVLIQLRRPQDARPMLEEIQRRKPNDLSTAGNLVLVYLQIGQLAQAVSMAERMSTMQPENIDYRLDFAERLQQAEARDIVVALTRQVLEQQPKNIEARVTQANAYIHSFEPHLALNVLKEEVPAEWNKDWELMMATGHIVIGEYGDALVRLRELLLRYPDDVRVRLSLGDLFIASEEYEKARQQHHRAEQLAPKDRTPKLRLARNYSVQRFFDRSNEYLRLLISERPHDSEAFQLLCENLIETKQPDEVERLIHARRQKGSRDKPEALEMHLGLGRALLLVDKPLEAYYEFEEAARLVDVARPEGLYGTYSSLKKLHNLQHARERLLTELDQVPLQAYYRYSIARLAIRDCDFHVAAELLATVVQFDPQHDLAACWLALCQQKLAPSGQIGIGTYQNILAHAPANVIARLNLARSYAFQHANELTQVHYDLLIRHYPVSLVAMRERARELQNWKGWDCACPAYQAAYDMAKHGDPLLAPPVRPGVVPTPAQAEEYSLGEADAQITATEKEAKGLRGWRTMASAPVFRSLTMQEPSNGDGFFELGQGLSLLDSTQDSLCAYDDLLNLDACNREAMIAYRRGLLELRPRTSTSYDYFEQFGRQDLTSVRRSLVTENVYIPYGDEDEYWTLGYSRAIYDPVLAPLLTGNHFRTGVNGKFDMTWRYWGLMTIEQYQDRISTRPTYNAGVEYRGCDSLTLRGSSFLDNVVENSESMRQDIYRIGLQMTADYNILRYWSMQTGFRFASYSDENEGWDFWVHNRFPLTLAPKQLSFLLDYDFTTFADSTIFNPNSDSLLGITHPYFSPDGYSMVSGVLEWKQWLCDDLFKGADQHYYILQYGLRFDSNSEAFNLFRVGYVRDVCSWLTVKLDAGLVRSGAYDSTGASAQVVIRFPLKCAPSECGPWLFNRRPLFHPPRALSPPTPSLCPPNWSGGGGPATGASPYCPTCAPH